MRRLAIIFSPQCPANVYFIDKIREWAEPYGVDVKVINAFEDQERARTFLTRTRVGFDRHMFITVFIDDRWIPGHPGNPKFKQDLLKELGGSEDG
ncbi:MAG: hypothetical protein JSV18_05430 [Candidatus Bathyarchaeota archaeon]|nr:MAG: hypothetical protein JSV18_05430 [Candidatus Bathyarchaeota archaeon]